MQRLTGLVQPLPVNIAADKTIARALSDLLHLGTFTQAIQEYVGGLMAVTGTIVLNGKALKLVLYVTLPDDRKYTLELVEDDGDPFKLIRRGANASLAHFYPGRAIILNLRRSLLTGSPTISEVRQQVDAELAKSGEETKYQVQSTIWTLRGAVAFIESDQAMTAQALDRALREPDISPAIYSIARLNRAFIAIIQRRPTDAISDYRASLEVADRVDLAGYVPMVAVTGALAHWQDGHPDIAIRMLNDVLERSPGNALALHYQKLLNKASASTADAVEPDGVGTAPFYPMVLPSVFWVDPVTWTATRRPVQ